MTCNLHEEIMIIIPCISKASPNIIFNWIAYLINNSDAQFSLTIIERIRKSWTTFNAIFVFFVVVCVYVRFLFMNRKWKLSIRWRWFNILWIIDGVCRLLIHFWMNDRNIQLLNYCLWIDSFLHIICATLVCGVRFSVRIYIHSIGSVCDSHSFIFRFFSPYWISVSLQFFVVVVWNLERKRAMNILKIRQFHRFEPFRYWKYWKSFVLQSINFSLFFYIKL